MAAITHVMQEPDLFWGTHHAHAAGQPQGNSFESKAFQNVQ